MKFINTIVYLCIGILFGIVMYKSEAASWFRIYEMFNFASFHMYGIMGSAITVGAIGVWFMKRKNIKAINGKELCLEPKDRSIYRYLLGGIIFGLGWGLVGACPGPMYTLVGVGYTSIFIVIAGALLGTLTYGVIKKYLPH